MLKKMVSRKGEGVVTGMLWMSVTAIVSGTIAYSIWATVSTSAGTLKSLITTTIQ